MKLWLIKFATFGMARGEGKRDAIPARFSRRKGKLMRPKRPLKLAYRRMENDERPRQAWRVLGARSWRALSNSDDSAFFPSAKLVARSLD